MEWCQREGLRQLEWIFKPGTGKDRSSLLWFPGEGLLMRFVFIFLFYLFLLIFLFFVNRKKYANKPQKYANIRKSTQILIFVLRAIWEKRWNLSEPFWFLQLQFQFGTFLGHLGFDWNDWWKRAIVSEKSVVSAMLEAPFTDSSATELTTNSNNISWAVRWPHHTNS